VHLRFVPGYLVLTIASLASAQETVESADATASRAADGAAGRIAEVNVTGDAGATPVSPPSMSAASEEPDTADDGWPDLSAFLDRAYGFLPLARPITEPAVGYGGAGGLMFLSKSFGDARAGLGRPNITFVGGMGTANGTWGVVAMDSRFWLEDHLQTVTVATYASVNLDYYGIGRTDLLENDPLRYELVPKGALLEAKYRFGQSSFWLGISGRYFSTGVTFEAPAGTPELPDHDSTNNLGGGAVLGFFDTRDNLFTPLRGTYVELSFGMFGAGPRRGGPIERVELVGIQYVLLPHGLYLAFRADIEATFGPAPFYFRPYIDMRGVPVMRYQGDEVAQLEAELRWQFWGRWSLLGFVGGGGGWNQFQRFHDAQGVLAGGGGFRYEVARAYGIHVGLDVAASPDTVAFYVIVGSAWMRP